MKTRLVLLLSVGSIIAIIVAASGCCMCWGWRGQEHYERTESMSAPMGGLEKISVDTSFGEIKIAGAETSDCNVTARVTGQASTVEEAKQLAEQTKIKLETDGKTLVIEAEKPYLKHNRSIGIAYDITVPIKTGINCKTSYGEVELKNIEGSIVAHTSFGQIKAENITGSVKLDTSYGEVDCEKITTGDFSAKTSFGAVKAGFTDSCPADLKAKIETSFGEIVADIPPNFAGNVSVETSFGNVKTELPILVKGDVGKTRIIGTIGQGEGKLDLKTSFGEVTIK